MSNDEQEQKLAAATRKLLFRNSPLSERVERKSAAEVPERHVRVKVTMNLDGDIVSHFKERAAKEGRSYQFLINEALRDSIEGSKTERLATELRHALLADEQFLQKMAEKIRR